VLEVLVDVLVDVLVELVVVVVVNTQHSVASISFQLPTLGLKR